MEKRTSQVVEEVRVKPSEMVNLDNLYSMRMDWEVYGFLMSLIFFHNQYCEENIIDFKKLSMNWRLEDSPEKDLPLEALQVCQRAKIVTMNDLVNYPSIEIIKIKGCNLEIIRSLKAYIIQAIQVIAYVRIPALKGRRYLKVINEELYNEFSENTVRDIKKWRSDDVV